MTATPPLETHGVSAQGGVGTPSPFWGMSGVGGKAESALEFSQVLARIAAAAAGPLGRARIADRTPQGDLEVVRSELAQVGEAMRLIERGEQPAVGPVPDLTITLGRLRLDGSVLEREGFLLIRELLSVAVPLRSGLVRVADQAPAVARLAVDPIDPALQARLDQVFDDEGEVRDSASVGLKTARRDVRDARDRLLQKLNALLQSLDAQTVAPGGSVTIREGRYVLPVRRDSRRRPAGIVHDESASHGTLFVEPTATIELGNALRSAVTKEATELLQVLRECTSLFRVHVPTLANALEMCVAADDLFTRARYALRVRGVVPTIEPAGGRLVIREGRHPLLVEIDGADAGNHRVVVPFDLELHADEHTLLISGPNTGGKTVLIKAIGLCVLLAQAGIVPPVGKGTVLPLVAAVYADIGDQQSIAANLSTFSAHVAELRVILEEANAASLVLVDEIGSGTDPVEGAALAAATLAALTARGVRTVASTHLGALKSLATEVPGIVNGSLQFDTETLTPSYRFQKGIPGRSYGLAIARRLGVNEDVLADADARLPEVERRLEALLEQVERRERDLAMAQAAVDAGTRALEGRQAEVIDREQSVSASEVELTKRSRALAQEAKQAARNYLLDARKTVEEAIAHASTTREDESATTARRMVEQEVQALQREEGTESSPPLFGLVAGKIDVGHRVRLANGSTGKVIDQRGDGRVVVAVGALKLVVSTAGLQPAPPEAPQPKAPKKIYTDNRPAAAHEIDLRGMRGDEAETTMLAALDAALLADYPALNIIHGMGTGVVRERVRQVLSHDPRVSHFAFAPHNQGGTGVTIVDLRGAG